ncbi:hypothetical protein DWUX_1217 [Desulfovibrio diazotrophicus]|nr:hypothetical protein DWUX_1217 [Desulfovibrio diazotrophicus]
MNLLCRRARQNRACGRAKRPYKNCFLPLTSVQAWPCGLYSSATEKWRFNELF